MSCGLTMPGAPYIQSGADHDQLLPARRLTEPDPETASRDAGGTGFDFTFHDGDKRTSWPYSD